MQRAEEIVHSGRSALYIIEAHVAAREGALTVVAKGIQVAEGKAPAVAAAAPPAAPQ